MINTKQLYQPKKSKHHILNEFDNIYIMHILFRGMKVSLAGWEELRKFGGSCYKKAGK